MVVLLKQNGDLAWLEEILSMSMKASCFSTQLLSTQPGMWSGPAAPWLLGGSAYLCSALLSVCASCLWCWWLDNVFPMRLFRLPDFSFSVVSCCLISPAVNAASQSLNKEQISPVSQGVLVECSLTDLITVTSSLHFLINPITPSVYGSRSTQSPVVTVFFENAPLCALKAVL